MQCLMPSFFPAFFDVSELTEDQRNLVAQMITSFTNENRMRTGRPAMTRQVKPKYFVTKASTKVGLDKLKCPYPKCGC